MVFASPQFPDPFLFTPVSVRCLQVALQLDLHKHNPSTNMTELMDVVTLGILGFR